MFALIQAAAEYVGANANSANAANQSLQTRLDGVWQTALDNPAIAAGAALAVLFGFLMLRTRGYRS